MNAWEITKKDLRLLTRDRRALSVLVALPLIFIAILGFSTSKLLDLKESRQEPKQEQAADEQAADGSSSPNVYQELVPSYTVMFVFFLVTIMGRSFIHERDLGTLRRLQVAPLSPAALLAGKTLPFYIISLAQGAVLFVAGRLLFGMTWGTQPWMLIPIVACTSLAATGLGLLIATVVRTDSQVSAYGNIVVIGMAGISGCFVPRDWLPETLQQISLITPHAWSLTAFNQLLVSDTPQIAVVLQCCAVLLGFAALFFVVGCRQFQRQ